jgi:hypothetical protein
MPKVLLVLLVGVVCILLGLWLALFANSIQASAIDRVSPDRASPFDRWITDHFVRPPVYPYSLRIIGIGAVVLGLVIIYIGLTPAP